MWSHFNTIISPENKLNRSSCQEVLCKKKNVLRNFVKLTAKQLCWGLFFNKKTDWACNFIKKLQHRCFSENFAKILRTAVLKNTCEWLLLIKIMIKTLESSLEFYRKKEKAFRSHRWLSCKARWPGSKWQNFSQYP